MLRRTPVIAYWSDGFTEGDGPFRADIVVSIDSVIATKVAMKAAHESQYFEWIPWNWDPESAWGSLPEEQDARRQAILKILANGSAEIAKRYTGRLPSGTAFAEAYQISEYGRTPDPEFLRTLFLTD